MKVSFNTLRGGYESPECEVVNLVVGSAVLIVSTGISSISDMEDDDDEDSINF